MLCLKQHKMALGMQVCAKLIVFFLHWQADSLPSWSPVYINIYINMGLAGNTGLIPGSERSPEEGNGSPLQYTCLANPMDKEAWLCSMG